MKVLLSSWLTWTLSQVTRQRVVILVGAIFLIMSSRSSWYTLPPDALEIFKANITLANYYRFLPILFALLAIFLFIWQNSKQIVRILFWIGLFTILLFPYVLATWSPTVSFLAQNYYSQGAKAGLNVENNFSEIQSQWKQNIKLDIPEKPEPTVSLLIENSKFFQLSSLDSFITNILAYNPSVFGFMNISWASAIIGFFISLFGLYLGKSDRALKAFVLDATKFIPWLALGLALLFLSVLLPNILNYQLGVAYASGEYSFVQSMSKTLATIYPPFQGNENFLERLAKSGYYCDRPEPYLIEFAKGLESYRLDDLSSAENHFQTSLSMQPNFFLVRGYLAAVLLNQGVNNFNLPDRRNASTAAVFFERALKVFPNHTEAIYDLMIARAINGEFELAANNAHMLIESQKYAQRPRSALLGQAYLHLAWENFKDNDFEKAWKRYRQSIDDGTWKDVIEESP